MKIETNRTCLFGLIGNTPSIVGIAGGWLLNLVLDGGNAPRQGFRLRAEDRGRYAFDSAPFDRLNCDLNYPAS